MQTIIASDFIQSCNE